MAKIRNKPAAGKSPTSSVFLLYTISCPKSWVGYEGRCYYFSSAEGTWDFSQRNSKESSDGSGSTRSAFQHDDFVMRYKISADHWFGLRREGEGQPWKWTNGSIFNNWFNIRAKGFCTYLNDEGAFSTRCDTLRNWICSKSLHSFHCKDVLRFPTNTSLLDSGYQLMKINCSMPES
ncbi:PREDICTED: C-type lectin domain family 2 member D-like [Gekko japonicus]|uniref:C-type lectin domain family 2 member D-like n=1 Tax=Gekko japonicus TaxID=146911 RepID=A0ABM1KMH3_GEKJA|nr:PREDICTED: C-type lectin domain family 2 member D-like [Gekko japonicus]